MSTGSEPTGRLTLVQHRLLWMPPAALAGLFAYLYAYKPDYVRLLWTDPMGVRMLAVILPGLLGGGIFYGVGCRLLNRHASRLGSTATQLVQVLLAMVWLLGCCVPTGFVMQAGPAAVQIQRNLNSSK